MNMLSKLLKRPISIIFLVILFGSWADKTDISAVIKDDFTEKSFESKLVTEVNTKLKIIWRPNWEKIYFVNEGNPITKALVPLSPVLTNAQNSCLESDFEMPLTKRYLFVEKETSGIKYSLKTYVLKSSKKADSGTLSADDFLDNNFTGMILVKNLDNDNATLRNYNNGKLIEKSNTAWECVFWTVCTYVRGGGGPLSCAQYVTTTSARSPYPYAYPCGHPSYNSQCQYILVSSYVERYCE
ncbi:hypothetical protein EDD80_101268 [Anseongella ginsenosidimutans]|uniref:Uncharacterized protein n=1 Tax=Anseongella ginsenosidimutans TaxID=496056 RepID=A0A4R3KZL3_9SPHI|nr:hypothetical protein [Anseongella ginsenosidimutans]QEC51249.1 hypothetical protein FRZ59_02030 [Anseongella ginsenosidimutans]TCS90070.1 hypothetical protein EDD80_101268 [Anseongella ginsenosidimutans]